MTEKQRPFGLYIHWPFCLSKCPYCDFNSHVRNHVDFSLWEKALLAELEYYGKQTKGRILTSIFFGGGTPSLMPPFLVARLIDQCSVYWNLNPSLEITLEANPTSSESLSFKALAKAGVNRLSLGIQALNDQDLHFLGRQHKAEEALNALYMAQDIFPRFSFDLIYARPNQSLKNWEQELKQALALKSNHLSLYQLTIEPNTAFATFVHQKKFIPLDEEPSDNLYDLTQSMLEDHDLPAYEISNHARKGHESLHNLIYWHYDDYIGIGPGAHGRLTLDNIKYTTYQERLPETWLKTVLHQGHATHTKSLLTFEEKFQEFMLMNLRLKDGFTLKRFDAEFNQSFDTLLNPKIVQNLIDYNLVVKNDENFSLTKNGFKKLNAVLYHLLA
ncbi:MAG: radical SAM family heme chaperone HemW [Alphaproteobacteria bacterium]|nr:radical SAM family heme chaperone HemW [Alphaproteobacteria bacterium]